MGYGDLEMRSPYDVLRSLTYYVSLALPDEWSVVETVEEGVMARPFATVVETPAIRAVTNPRVAEVNKSFNIFAYPEPVTNHPMRGRAEAAKIEEALLDLFSMGLDEGRPLRVPLYDFDSTGPDEMSDQRRAVDFAQVQSLSVNVVQADDDEDLFTVLVEVRLWWTRNALVPSTAKRVTGTTPPDFRA